MAFGQRCTLSSTRIEGMEICRQSLGRTIYQGDLLVSISTCCEPSFRLPMFSCRFWSPHLVGLCVLRTLLCLYHLDLKACPPFLLPRPSPSFLLSRGSKPRFPSSPPHLYTHIIRFHLPPTSSCTSLYPPFLRSTNLTSAGCTRRRRWQAIR